MVTEEKVRQIVAEWQTAKREAREARLESREKAKALRKIEEILEAIKSSV